MPKKYGVKFYVNAGAEEPYVYERNIESDDIEKTINGLFDYKFIDIPHNKLAVYKIRSSAVIEVTAFELEEVAFEIKEEVNND